jgi:hypothetical protein
MAKKVCYFIEDSKTKLRWMYWNQGKYFHRPSDIGLGHLITYHSIERAEAAIRQMKPKTLPYFSTKNDLVVRKIIYEIQGE